MQKKWIEAKKKIAMLKRTNFKVNAENQKLCDKLSDLDNELNTVRVALREAKDEAKFLNNEILRLQKEQVRLKIICQAQQPQISSKSVDSTENIFKRARSGSFRASSISVESTAKNSDEAEYLKELQRLDDEGDEEFNETWVLAAMGSDQEDETDVNSEEFRKEIEDLM